MRVPDDKSTCTLKELIFKDNKLQGVKGYVQWNNGNSPENRTVHYTLSNNTTLPYDENLKEDNLLVSSIYILHNNQTTTEIAVGEDRVKLDKIVRVAERDEDGNIYIKVDREGQIKPYEIMVAATVTPISIESMDIRLKEDSVEWKEANLMPEILFEGYTLNKDYTVSGVQVYKNIGTYPVTVTGIGNYVGTKALTYTIYVVKGHTYTISGYVYKITGDNTVSVTGVTNKKKTTVSVKSSVKIGNKTYKVTAIEKNAFENNKKLKKVTIVKNVTTIGTNAFYGCNKLKKVTIGKNVTTIGTKAFYKCTKLSKITIPSKVTKIGKQAFSGCKTLKSIRIKTTKLQSSKV